MIRDYADEGADTVEALHLGTKGPSARDHAGLAAAGGIAGAFILAGAILAARMRRPDGSPDASRARSPVNKSRIEEKGTAHE